MWQIDASRRPPLEQLAVDYACATLRADHPSIDFCRRLAGLPEDDAVVAKRLGIEVTAIRGWREIGRRAMPTRSTR
jgi:hypothetical protein